MTAPPRLIDLDQARPGFRRFIGAWVVEARELTYVVDPGPSSTAVFLIRRLRELGIRRLDFVLLTHLHIDHAGGTSLVAEAFPEARIVASPEHAHHLVDPTSLWSGTRAVLGDLADVYGPIGSVAPERVAPLEELEARGVRSVPTPGHAPHHVTYHHDDLLFVGEALGTRADTPAGIYRRPATPRRFDAAAAIASIDRLAAIEPAPASLLFGHHGMETASSRATMAAARAQLLHWIAVVENTPNDAADDAFAAACERLLLANDPAFAHFVRLDPDIQERERVFVRNSLDGIRDSVRHAKRAGERTHFA